MTVLRTQGSWGCVLLGSAVCGRRLVRSFKQHLQRTRPQTRSEQDKAHPSVFSSVFDTRVPEKLRPSGLRARQRLRRHTTTWRRLRMAAAERHQVDRVHHPRERCAGGAGCVCVHRTSCDTRYCAMATSQSPIIGGISLVYVA